MLQAGCDDHLGNLERLPCLQGDSQQEYPAVVCCANGWELLAYATVS